MERPEHEIRPSITSLHILFALSKETGSKQRHTYKRHTSPSVFYSISLPGSDDGAGSSDLGHYCTKFVTLGLRMLSVSGGLSDCVPIV